MRHASAGGEFRKQPGHRIDIAATCADKALDREAIYWEYEGNRAVGRRPKVGRQARLDVNVVRPK
ncbi:unnamed protein product [Gemmata massiliana]|uniref:Uncharacterized protein n=1 Tax=Gemmata massiliana TaxID=1210884 RepID=A0A6P2DCE9_9BACT|nr:hypothetical protein [Gemmata massiliana]VTR98035.1 unnamed protein product [Gemmata massiliana]